MSEDYILRAYAAGGDIRAFAVTSRSLVQEAKQRHGTSPVVTAALGRLLSAGAMMGVMMKGEKDILTLQVRGDGPLRGLTVTADSAGNVKGYPIVPSVIIPANDKGKLDVGGAVGSGYLRVVKDLGMKEPYSGQVDLQTGEIAEDLTYYFAVSEQVPSAVGLGVLMEKNNTVKQAGGFIIQLMPGAGEDDISALESKLACINSVTSMLDAGMTPEDILDLLLGDMGLVITDKIPAAFYCGCGRERVEKVLYGISNDELISMANDKKPVEIKCDFCGNKYIFSSEDIANIVREKIK